jgi:hypothetical protein
MFVKTLRTSGGFTSLTRYANFLAGFPKFIASTSSNMIAIGQDGSPYFQAYAFSSSTGFGSRYTSPATSPSFYTQDLSFNRIKTLIGIGDYSSPYVHIYPLTPGGGYGSKWANPATLPSGTGTGISFDYDTSVVAVSHNSSPNITVYPISSGSFGTKYSNPATAPNSSSGGRVKITQEYAFVGTSSGEYIYGYPFTTTTGFGTKFAAPTSPGYTPHAVDFNIATSTLVIGGIGYTNIYPITSSGFGTKYANLSGSPWGYGAKFNISGDTLFIATSISPFINAYPFSVGSGGGTKYANPATLPVDGKGSGSSSINVTYDSNAVAVNTNSSPFIYACSFTVGTGFGAKYSDPATALSFTGQGLSFN